MTAAAKDRLAVSMMVGGLLVSAAFMLVRLNVGREANWAVAVSVFFWGVWFVGKSIRKQSRMNEFYEEQRRAAAESEREKRA